MSARALSRSRMDARVTLRYKVHEIANGGQERSAEHDPEKAWPGLDRGWEPIFGKRSCSNKKLRYSALMLASRITLPHFAESARMRAAKSSGELTIEVMKLEARTRSRNCGSVKIRCVSALSLSIIAPGVLAGANSPYQEPAS